MTVHNHNVQLLATGIYKVYNNILPDIVREIFPFANQTLAVDIANILSRNNLMQLANNADLYLYGHQDITPCDNKLVLTSTIQYMKNIQRFPR